MDILPFSDGPILKGKTVLYVSDSLGLSLTHHRGVSNYSMVLVDMLKSLGMDLTLLVERVDGYGLLTQAPDLEGKFAKIILSAEISEIYRYFNESLFNFSWDLRPISFIGSTGGATKQVDRSLYERLDRRPLLLRNGDDAQDFYPKRGSHLRAFQGFLGMDYVYSDAPAFCRLNVAPIKIDASGFDYVVVDSPHYVVFENIDRKNVFVVIHDAIPVTDRSWSWDWRTLFVQKIKAGAQSSGNLIYVSEHTRTDFRRIFQDFAEAARSEIIYPTISDELVRESGSAVRAGQSDYISRISADKPAEKVRNMVGRLSRQRKSFSIESKDFATEAGKFGTWNGALPYLCSILSDEERKNIPAIVNVSKDFVGQLNFIVMGKIDGDKYFDWKPEEFHNVHFTGIVSAVQKQDILNNALGFIFPSYSEGFGIPIAEAGLYSIPLLCSDLPVFHEIAGDKALYFDPANVTSLSKKIRELITDIDRHSENAKLLRKTLVDRFSQSQMVVRLAAYLNSSGAGSLDRLSIENGAHIYAARQ